MSGKSFAATNSKEGTGPTAKELRHFFDASLDMLCIAGFDGYYKRLNPAWERTLGYTVEELMARRYVDFVHPDDVIATLREAERLNHGANSISFENRYRCKDGSYRWLMWRATPDAEQKVIYAIARDITERKELEEAHLRTEQRLQAILDNTTAVIFMKDVNGRYLLINRRWSELFHISPEAIIGKSDDEVFPADLARAFRENDLKVLAAGEPLVLEEIAPHDDGQHHYISVKFPLYDASGRPTAVGGIATDITDRKCAEEDLRRSNRELAQIAQVTSRDLQTPLALIAAQLQQLEQRLRKKPDDMALNQVRLALDGTAHMRELLQALLDYSLAGNRDKPFTECDCTELLKKAVASLDPVIASSGATISHDPLPRVLGDEPQLVRVFEHLLANAIKFCGNSPPVIHISASSENGQQVVSMKDNGIGVDRRNLERIFSLFERASSSSLKPGNGVGLAVCRKIIERHGGRIRVESALGRGSTFKFSLPAPPDRKRRGK